MGSASVPGENVSQAVDGQRGVGLVGASLPETSGDGIALGAGLVDEEVCVFDEVDILAEFDERELALFADLDQAEGLLPLGPFLAAVKGEHVSSEWDG